MKLLINFENAAGKKHFDVTLILYLSDILLNLKGINYNKLLKIFFDKLCLMMFNHNIEFNDALLYWLE